MLFERELLSFKNEVNVSKEGFLKFKFQRDLWCQKYFSEFTWLRSSEHFPMGLSCQGEVRKERKKRINERVGENFCRHITSVKCRQLSHGCQSFFQNITIVGYRCRVCSFARLDR